MELVYLWVEEYKNIHKQGFNFSPRFECKFHYEYEKYIDNGEEKERLKDNCKLDICDKKKNECKDNDYIENFFDEKGKVNITAIVGKNGSGKSSIITLLEHIESYPCELYLTKRMPFIILFYIDEKKKGFTNIQKLSDRNNLFEFVESPHHLPPTHQDSMGRGVHKHKCTFSEYFSFLTLNSEMPYPYEDYSKLKIERNKTINYSQSNIADLSIKNAKNNFTFELTTFMLFPKTIQVFSKESLVSKYIEEINEVKFTQSRSTYIQQVRDIFINETIQDGQSYTINNPLEAYMINQIVKNGECISFLNRYQDSKDANIIEECYNKINSTHKYSLGEFDELINKWHDITDITKKQKELLIKYKKFLKFDFEDIQGRRFSNLSHGEKSIYAQHISIYDVIKKLDKTLIALDEPTLSLHPNWQKKYINELINLLQKVEGSYYVVLTSHSPFLLSDIPKQNIIFLDKEENGNCKILTHEKVLEKKQTFGANIHTLLSDSFFMKNGLMGEFAKSKINEIIKNLQDDEYKPKEQEKDQLLLIIESIGEPFLRSKMLDMYNRKFIKEYKEREKKKIEEQINQLKSKLKELDND